ncbi:MFS transporter [Cupriavidus sp. USMAA2-4]|uniref:MFS transporter n=1 Tax=Cupriavidus malaysiensis TaxID=367825 RepID=A0ABN4TSZ9_9BURK|nr:MULTISPECIES: tripartite tricarboxylate transporter substrate binding protein [Cupriavidus]AOY94647.1 MFS transporter [Cupriavidus sp. USMAA2-4]AOZ10143.1 MFS transporter [Cupriavidus malaysiensis]
MAVPQPFAGRLPAASTRLTHLTRLAGVCAALLGLGAAAPAAGAAEDAWPSKPIRVIVPYTPGGSTDTVARVVFEKVGERLKQTIIVENRPGANSTVGTTVAARAKGDGYTFLAVLAAYSANPSLYKSLPYKPADLKPVSHMADLPLFLFSAKQIPARSVAELVEYGRRNPGKLNFASSGTGSSAHLVGTRFAMVSKLEMTHIPYNGSAPILTDLMSGQVSMVFDPLLVPMPQARAGKINVLAVASAKRLAAAPDVPTMEEAGFPGFVMSSWTGLLAPAGTPQAVVDRMSRTIAEVVRQPEVQKRLEDLGYVAVGSTPAEFQKLIERDGARYAEIIKAGHISLD